MQMKKCKACKAEWIARTEKPVRCPRCQSKKWNGGKNEKKIS